MHFENFARKDVGEGVEGVRRKLVHLVERRKALEAAKLSGDEVGLKRLLGDAKLKDYSQVYEDLNQEINDTRDELEGYGEK